MIKTLGIAAMAVMLLAGPALAAHADGRGFQVPQVAHAGSTPRRGFGRQAMTLKITAHELKAFGNHLVALGMLYYRLRDAL